jgi:hypothetical protein
MENVVHSFRDSAYKCRISDVAVDQTNAMMLHGAHQIVTIASHKIVDYTDLGNTRGQKLIDNRASDEAGPTGHEAARIC